MIPRPSLTIGVEEEYLVVDRETRDLVRDPDPAFLKACEERIGEQVTPEYLRCQVEIGTQPVQTVAEAREDLKRLRRAVAAACEEFGYAPIAASTHPFAKWREQTHTPKPRYDELRKDLGAAVRRLLICGCHVHCAVEDDDLRIDLMNQATYFLPHILALTCSSPYWQGEDTGLSSYRLTVFDALPRTGLPDTLDSYAQYKRLVQQLVNAGCIEDATKIWWDIRPSAKFPTVEMRVADVCTRLEDAVTIAAVYQSLFSYLWKLRRRNQRWRLYPNTLIQENRWRAQRYGSRGELVDHGLGELVPFNSLMEELIGIIAEDAEELGCLEEVLRIRQIAVEGTSADRQRAAYTNAVSTGSDHEGAMRKVVDHIIAETVEGL
jgi:carboxylate-amine ligase